MKKTRLAAALVAISLVGSSAALADNLTNDVAVVNDVKQATIVSAGSGVAVKYKVVDTGNEGCDVDQHSSLTVTVDAAAGVTATPSSINFTIAECNDGTEKTITFTSSTPGVHAITHTLDFKERGGAHRSMGNQANFTLNVRPRPAGTLTATAGDGEVDLSWLASADAGIDGYKVYQGAGTTAIASVTGASYKVEQLTNGTEYCFTVKAYKGSLESDASNSACATPTGGAATYTGAFLAPVDGGGTINVVKLGRVVPVKLEISDGTDEMKSGTVEFFRRTGSCNSASDSSAVEETAGSSNVGNQFKFVQEGADDYWQFNLPTKNLGTGCFTFDITYNGTVAAQFTLQTTK